MKLRGQSMKLSLLTPFVLSTVKTVMKTFTDLSSVLPIQLIYNDSMYCRCPKDCWHVANMFIEQWG